MYREKYLMLQKYRIGTGILLKTILNSIENRKGFVYESVDISPEPKQEDHLWWLARNIEES